MKTALLAASMMLLSESPVGTPTPVDPSIRAVIESQTAAWGHDAAAWTKDFTDDARFVNVRGDSVVGKPAIEKIHAFIFAGPYKDTQCNVRFESVTFPSPDLALVETVAVLTGIKTMPPGLVPTIPGEFHTRLTYVLVLRNGAWKIQFVQNTAISPVAMPVK